MAVSISQDTNFTTSVKSLSQQIFGKNPKKESMLQLAVGYFHIANIQQLAAKEVSNKAENDVRSHTRSRVKNQGNDLIRHDLYREQRYAQLDNLCRDILLLSEGDSFTEDNRKSARLLATIQLLSPNDISKVPASNELNKPLYKAVLCLRVLDKLCIDNSISEPYIKERLAGIPPEKYARFSSIDPISYKRFVEEVKIPLVKAALLQDIGNNHPDAQLILKGKSGKEDPFRVLSVEDRKNLLQIDYRETIKYLVEGVGVAKYVGNLKVERDHFDKKEKQKLLFIKTLLKSSINPQKGIGNLLKVPQIYTSIILSTKSNYNYALLPKVYQALYKNAEKGVCHRIVVDAMKAITGTFPLGYGVTYLSENTQGDKQYCYEYAIVKGLYPEDPEMPLCRTTTRNLSFISFGQDIVVAKDRNLHFTEVSKKLVTMDKGRLNEILSLLSSNHTERSKEDLIPRYWLANEYFTTKAHQNLWNK
jgi:hypothetical protein